MCVILRLVETGSKWLVNETNCSECKKVRKNITTRENEKILGMQFFLGKCKYISIAIYFHPFFNHYQSRESLNKNVF